MRMRKLLLAATAVGIAAGVAGPTFAETRLGDNNNITTNAVARNVTAVAIGNRSSVAATVAGISSGGDVRIGDRNNVNLNGRARNVTAVAIGNRTGANACVGGICGR